MSQNSHPLPVNSLMTEHDKAAREAILRRCAELVQQGTCPTCRQFLTGDVFPGQATQIYYGIVS